MVESARINNLNFFQKASAEWRRFFNKPITPFEMSIKKFLFPVTIQFGESYMLVTYDRFTGQTFGGKLSTVNDEKITAYRSFNGLSKTLPTIFEPI